MSRYINVYTILIGLFAVGLFVMNQLAPLMSDDYFYSFVVGGDGIYQTRFVSSWADIIESNWRHYQQINGRFFVHVLAQYVLWGGKGWMWSVCNTLCLLANAWLLFSLACPKERYPNRLTGYLLTLTLFWLLLPIPGQTFFWVSGSCNYQWASLLILSFLYLWNMPQSRWAMWLALPVGLLAGNSNEALSLGLGVALVLYTLIRFRSLTRMQKWAVAVFLLGVLSNVKAPGVAVRLGRGGIDAPLWMDLVFRTVRGGAELVRNRITVVILPCCLFALSFWEAFRTRKLPFPYLLIAAVLALGAAVYSQEINERSLFALFLFSFLMALPIIIRFFNACSAMFRYGVGIVLAASALGVGIWGGYSMHRYACIERQFFEALQRNEPAVWPAGDFFQSRFIACAAMPDENSTTHFNRYCAAYYQVKPYSSGREDHTPWRRLLAEASAIEPGCYRTSEDGAYILVKFPHPVDYGRVTGYVDPNAAMSLYDKLVRRMFAWKSYDCHGGVWNDKGLSYAIIQSGPMTVSVRIQTSSHRVKKMWSLDPTQESGCLKREE